MKKCQHRRVSKGRFYDRIIELSHWGILRRTLFLNYYCVHRRALFLAAVREPPLIERRRPKEKHNSFNGPFPFSVCVCACKTQHQNNATKLQHENWTKIAFHSDAMEKKGPKTGFIQGWCAAGNGDLPDAVYIQTAQRISNFFFIPSL